MRRREGKIALLLTHRIAQRLHPTRPAHTPLLSKLAPRMYLRKLIIALLLTHRVAQQLSPTHVIGKGNNSPARTPLLNQLAPRM
jgi:hypothetical protein